MSTHDEDPNSAPQPPSEENPKLQGIDYAEGVNVRGIHESILREKIEPQEGMEPVPLWLMAVIMCTLFAGGIYLGLFSGGFRSDVFDENAGTAFSLGAGKAGVEAAATANAAPEDPAVAQLKLGKRTFTNNCASCHQPTGMGVPGQYPPLVKSEWVLGPERRVAAIVLYGLEGPVTVQGAIYNGAMPVWGKNLNDKQIAAVLTYVRQTWGNTAPAITPEQVKTVRDENATRAKAWCEAELKALPETPVPGGSSAPAAVPAKKS